MKRFDIIATKRYRKDYKRIARSGWDLSKLERVIDSLAQDKKLPDACHDHALKGALEGTRECHISPDWLLHYEKNENSLVLLLISTGSHRRVLGIE